jgi:hypothetical protein
MDDMISTNFSYNFPYRTLWKRGLLGHPFSLPVFLKEINGHILDDIALGKG